MHALCAGQLQEVRGLIASLELPVPGAGTTAPLAALQGLPAEERAATLASVQAAMNDTMQDISQLLANMHEVGLRCRLCRTARNVCARLPAASSHTAACAF